MVVSSGVAACCGQVTLLLFSSLLAYDTVGINVLHNTQIYRCFVTKKRAEVCLYSLR